MVLSGWCKGPLTTAAGAVGSRWIRRLLGKSRRLLSTLTPDNAAVLDDAWLVELDRRSRELDAGTVQAVPWTEVQNLARERAKLNN